MARNFKIQTSGTDRTFFIDLIGDFDGSSAFELLNLLQEKVESPNHKAYVNTSRLKTIHPFGRDVFKRNFPQITHLQHVMFTGVYAAEIAPADRTTARWQQDVPKNLPFVERFDTACSGDSRRLPAGGE